MANDWNCQTADLVLFSSIFFYSYGIMQIFAGLLSDIMEPAFLIGGSQLICAVGSIICGLATKPAYGTIGRLLVGLGCGPVYVPICRCMANWFDLKWYPTLSGVLIVIGGLGGLLASRPLQMLTSALGWKNTFHLFGGITGVLSILCIIIVRGNPTTLGYKPVNLETSDTTSDETLKMKLVQLKDNILVILKKPGYFLISFYSLLANGPYYNTAALWGKQIIRDVFNYSAMDASNALITNSLGVIFAAIILPFTSDHLHSRKWVLFAISVLGGAVHLWAFIAGEKLQKWAVYTIFAIIGFTTLPATSVCYPLLREYFHVSVAGSAIGCANFVAFIFSGLYQSLSSAIVKSYGERAPNVYTVKGFKLGFWMLGMIYMFVGGLVAAILKDSEFISTKKRVNLELQKSLLGETSDIQSMDEMGTKII
ncbi:Major Facilitator Superfamily protein [Trichomonas vaginalis G3]|uniref:Lysosomal dipeptide transporter MFSD1 n=1 Tax=Trichomonas vaginalis (strain ATCC PRA-98 / G3) TaxID=412133 RepID=A2EXH0_TRIV3|nr:major facilitator superfamily transporter [Trichomonas vaginalis G3]EAY02660.1 Major Facilitator Superfamily protein [Trichomonas vaginalis G3]KAI5550154.1 Major Facilitator Superfamily [Trichomonas vaginalis G3]|eukprot:XP_001314883.1 major facilitator superfamily transporter [Trichomonas vaginalis G3]